VPDAIFLNKTVLIALNILILFVIISTDGGFCDGWQKQQK